VVVDAQDDVPLFQELSSRAVRGKVGDNNSVYVRRYSELFTQRFSEICTTMPRKVPSLRTCARLLHMTNRLGAARA